jgi:VWA domain-containing protein
VIQLRLPERASGQSLPLADAPRVWSASRRTRLLRVLLAIVLLGLLVSLLVSSLRLKTRPTSYFAEGGGGLAVVDFSKSIDPRSFRRMSTILRTLADSNQRLGLIAFSDDAYMMLPPGTRGDEVRPMLRFFTGKEFTTLASIQTPWSAAFLGGTQIASGLRAARLEFEREGIKHGSVLLISDLDDSSTDIPIVTEELTTYRREGLRLRIAPLFAAPENLAFFAGLAGPGSVLGSQELLDNSKVAESQSVVGSFPKWLFFGGALVLLGIALNERLTRRLEWET